MLQLIGPVLGALGASKTAVALGTAVGGALSTRQQAKAQAAANTTDLVALRARAKAAGFNPLTVLQATGGQGFAAQPIPSFLSALGSQVGAFAQTYYELDRQENLDARAGQLAQAQIENLNASTKRLQQPVLQAPAARPKDEIEIYGPLEGQKWVKMYHAVSGNEFYLREGVLKTLRKTTDQWTAEDEEALFGEVVGEFKGLASAFDSLFSGASVMKRGGSSSEDTDEDVDLGEIILPTEPRPRGTGFKMGGR